MSKTVGLSDPLYTYLLDHSVREHPLLTRLRQETADHPWGPMQISPDQGQLMMLLIQLLRAKQTLEIGVFTGYSALCTALALPDDGKLIACDVRDEYTCIARRYSQEAGVDHKIDLRIAPALQTLDQLLAEGQTDRFDFAFIDADKENYMKYWEAVLPKIRPNGLVVVDNVLWSGKVLDPKEPSDEAIVEFNDYAKNDSRVELVMLTVRDGVTVARKRLEDEITSQDDSEDEEQQ